MIRLGVRYAWLDVLCLRQCAQSTLATDLVIPVRMEVVESIPVSTEVMEDCKSTVFYRTPAPIIVYYFPYITCLLYLLFLIKHVRTSG